MAQEAYCPIHGPYDAQLGACPYCQREGRAGAGVQSEDSTRVYSGRGQVRDDVDELETDISWRRGQPGTREEEDADETMIERRVEGLLGWLIVRRGDRRGRIFNLAKQTTIGRKGTTIVLNDPKVSRLHAKIGIVNDQIMIVDVLSENGTFVNGERLQGERLLQENDEVRIGDTLMVLKVLPADKE